MSDPKRPTRPPKGQRPTHHLRILEKVWVTKDMVRIVAGGDEFSDILHNECTDAYVKLLFSHDGTPLTEPDGEAVVNAQARAFNTACEQLSAHVGPLQLRHLANSAATLTRPDLHFEMVRCGLAIYGYAPLPCDLPLVPALTLESSLALVKQVPAGQGVSYGHRYVCPSDSLLGIVPLGYADGLHRAASGKMSVIVHARSGSVLVPQRGRICMDQIVVDLSTVPDAAAGDRVTVFGPGELTAKHLAAAAGTIDYEILTSLSTRVPRVESEA